VWSFPGGTRQRTIEFDVGGWWQVGPERVFVEAPVPGSPAAVDLRSWGLADGERQVLGRVDASRLGLTSSAFEPHGRGWLYTKGPKTWFLPLPVGREGARLFSQHATDVTLAARLGADLLAQREASGESRILTFPEEGPPLTQVLAKPASLPAGVAPTSSARFFRNNPGDDARLRLWDTTTLPGARPLELRREGSWYLPGVAVHPSERLVVAVTHAMDRLTFWPLPARATSVVDGDKTVGGPMAFSPDSRWLAAFGADGRLRLWPVPGTGSAEVKLLETPLMRFWADIVFDPKGRYLFVVGIKDNAWIVPLDGSPGRRLPAYSDDVYLHAAAASPTGRLVATAFGFGSGPKTLRVFDVETGAVRVFDLPVPSPPPGSAPQAPNGYEGRVTGFAFVDDKTLYTAGHGGIRRWNLETGAVETVKDFGPATVCGMAMSEDRRTGYLTRWSHSGGNEGSQDELCAPLERLDLGTGNLTPLPQFGDCVSSGRMSGSVLAATSEDGIVRVGRVPDGGVHLLQGHVGVVGTAVASPDLKWVASVGDDKTLRLWPMPDLDQPPLHALPHDELVAKLKSLTNLCAVRDPKSSTGWTIELGPFPGWKDVPTW
jgi:WD40 repeat protein